MNKLCCATGYWLPCSLFKFFPKLGRCINCGFSLSDRIFFKAVPERTAYLFSSTQCKWRHILYNVKSFHLKPASNSKWLIAPHKYSSCRRWWLIGTDSLTLMAQWDHLEIICMRIVTKSFPSLWQHSIVFYVRGLVKYIRTVYTQVEANVMPLVVSVKTCVVT